MYIITLCIVSFPYTVLQFTLPRLALISQSEAVYTVDVLIFYDMKSLT